MMDFIFGGRTGIASPDDLARRRELVHALRARSAGQVPQNMWEGLNSLTEAIGGRIEEGRLDAAEAAGRKAVDEKFRSFLRSGLSGQADDAAWFDTVSDPWLSESQREALRLYRQQQAPGAETGPELGKPEMEPTPKHTDIRPNGPGGVVEVTYKDKQKSTSMPGSNDETQSQPGFPPTAASQEISDFYQQAIKPRPVGNPPISKYGTSLSVPAFLRRQAWSGPR